MKDNSGKILLAMLAGASAGVIAGLMMAPDTGEATRTSVKKWAGKVSKDLEKNLQAGLDEIKSMSNDAYTKASSAASSAVDSAKDAVDSAKDKANQATSGSSTTGTSGNSTYNTGSTGSGAGSTGGGAGSTTGGKV